MVVGSAQSCGKPIKHAPFTARVKYVRRIRRLDRHSKGELIGRNALYEWGRVRVTRLFKYLRSRVHCQALKQLSIVQVA